MSKIGEANLVIPAQTLSDRTNNLNLTMREHILEKLKPLLRPFQIFDRQHAHFVLATLLDPRYCRGRLFSRMAHPALPPPQRKAVAKRLMDRYIEQCLIPQTCAVANFIKEEEERLKEQARVMQRSRQAGNDGSTGVEDEVDLLSHDDLIDDSMDGSQESDDQVSSILL